MPAFRMISDHLASSAAMSAAYSSGLTGSASAPSSASRRLHVLGRERGVQRRVELFDHRPRRAGRRDDAVVQHRLVARQAASATVGRSGNSAERLPPVTASARTLLPSCASPTALAIVLKIMVTWPPTRSFSAGAGALVGHVVDLDARHAGEQLGGEMHARAGAGRAEGQLAWLLLGQRNQLGDRPRRHGRMHQHDIAARCDQADRREVLARVVADIGIERRIDRKRAGGDQQRVAVGLGLARPGASRWCRPAPPRFSITIGWPRLAAICSATMRAMTSLPPPAA